MKERLYVMDTIIVGCGFGGAVTARVLAESGKKVRIIERRNHIGGNCHDQYDEHGILIHTYGPHIFHTKQKEVYDFLSRFTDWYAYEHEVIGNIHGNYIPIPFNLCSLEMVYDEEKAKRIRDILINTYGEGTEVTVLELKQHSNKEIQEVANYVYENIFLKYTMKQWNQKPEEVDQSVIARVPVRISTDCRYFQDPWQGMPLDGYTRLFEKMLDHENIHLELNTDAKDIITFDYDNNSVYVDGKLFDGDIVFTGAVDELFNYHYGKLPYRSLRFQFEHYDKEYFQSKGVVNYTVSEDYTRITEFKYLTGQQAASTTIVKEYPMNYDHQGQEPYYAILTEENCTLHKHYEELAERFHMHLLGRLAQYRYYNMDAIVLEALQLAERLKG